MSDFKMINESQTNDPRGSGQVEMLARRETMADGRRYIIYYSFGEEGDNAMNRDSEATTEDV